MDEKIQRAMEQIVEETLKDQPQWEDAYNKQTEKNGETETEAEPEEKRIEESRRKGSWEVKEILRQLKRKYTELF